MEKDWNGKTFLDVFCADALLAQDGRGLIHVSFGTNDWRDNLFAISLEFLVHLIDPLVGHIHRNGRDFGLGVRVGLLEGAQFLLGSALLQEHR